MGFRNLIEFMNSEDEELFISALNLDDLGKQAVLRTISHEHKRMRQIEEIRNNPIKKRIIAYYQKLASAGDNAYMFDSIPIDTIEVEMTKISEKADFVIGVNGDSMAPDFMDGDKVFVKQCTEINVGEVGIFLRGNECFIKESGKYSLISRNKTYPDIPKSEEIRIVGKVLGKLQ